MLRRISANVYEIDLSSAMGVLAMFNVADLQAFHDDKADGQLDSRTSPFQIGEIDAEHLVAIKSLPAKRSAKECAAAERPAGVRPAKLKRLMMVHIPRGSLKESSVNQPI